MAVYPRRGQAAEREDSVTRPLLTLSILAEPGRSGNFVYGIVHHIRAQSQELCARYGGPGDCLEEAELCLTMRDTAENVVQLCLNIALA
jgi:hypothetical protein